jgi:hypothetical protein
LERTGSIGGSTDFIAILFEDYSKQAQIGGLIINYHNFGGRRNAIHLMTPAGRYIVRPGKGIIVFDDQIR